MPTARILASSYDTSSSYLTILNSRNMYTDVDSDTYAQVVHNRNTSSTYYIYVRGFDFSLVPDDAIVTSAIVRLKAQLQYANPTNAGLFDGTTSLGNYLKPNVSGSIAISSFDITGDFSRYKSLDDFGVRIGLNRSASKTASNLKIYGVEITVEYTVAKKTCKISYNGNTIADTEEDGDVNITYNGSMLASAVSGTKRLTCGGKMMAADVVIGSKTLRCAGKYMSDDIIVEVI